MAYLLWPFRELYSLYQQNLTKNVNHTDRCRCLLKSKKGMQWTCSRLCKTTSSKPACKSGGNQNDQSCDYICSPRAWCTGSGMRQHTWNCTAVLNTYSATQKSMATDTDSGKQQDRNLYPPPLPRQHQSEARRQAAVGRTWGTGWGMATCRIGELVEVALASWLDV